MSYMKKSISIVLLTVLISSAPDALAKTKFYKSNTNLPFVEMMLSMMVAMGILDKIPPQFVSPTYFRPGAGWGNPYGRYSQLGLYPASLGGVSPLNSRLGGVSPLYSGLTGIPSYKHSQLGYPKYSPFKPQHFQKPLNRKQYKRKSVVKPPASRLYAEGFSKSSLNGLWMSDFGEMFAIKNGRFFWTDGQKNYIHGVMEITSDHVVASIENSDKVITYQYKIKGDELITRDKGAQSEYSPMWMWGRRSKTLKVLATENTA